MSRPTHHRISVSLVKALSLSESMSIIGWGIGRPRASRPSTSRDCSLAGSGNGLGPTGADFGGHQAVDDGANQEAAAGGYQVDFQESHRRAIPSVVSTDWALAPHGPAPPSTLPRTCGLPDDFSKRSRMDAPAENRRWGISWSSVRFPCYSMDSTKWGRAF